MATTVDFFAPNAFNLISWTEGINKIPNTYGRIRELGVFTDLPITTTMVLVEQMNGILNLVKSQPREGPPNLNISGRRTAKAFPVPHFPLDDVVLPSDIQDVRAWGNANVAETQAGVYARKLAEMRAKQAITLEWLRVGALRGIVLDSDGSTIVNWFTEFSITPKVINFALTTTTTNVLAKVLEAKRHIELNLKGEVMSSIRALCSPEFFESFTAHVSVHEAYAGYSEAAARFGSDMRSGFQFGGVIFEEYNGTATDKDGNARLFIPANEAVIFPMGTLNTFKTVLAPGNFMEAVNTPGQELYAHGEPRRMGQGTDIHTEMNALPIVRRPELLIRATRS